MCENTARTISFIGVTENLREILLLDIITRTLGIETVGGIMDPLIERNTIIPAKRSEIFSTYTNNQSGVLIQVYEDKHARIKENNLLGTIELSGISKPTPLGVPEIEVTFDIDAHENLNVTVNDKVTGESGSIYMTDWKGCTLKETRLKFPVQRRHRGSKSVR